MSTTDEKKVETPPKKKTTTTTAPDEIRETWFSKVFSFKLALLIHLFAYAAVNALCYMLNFMIWHGQLWAWHVTAGWGVGVLVHLVLYYIFTSDVKSVSKATFLVHLSVYAVISVYLLLINFVYMWKAPGVLWAHIPILLWGYAVLLHFLTSSMISGKGLSSKEIGQIVGKMLLLAHASYYVAVNFLLYILGLFNVVYKLANGTIFAWGIFLGLYAVITALSLYMEKLKGVLIHLAIYATVIIYGIANLTIFYEFNVFSPSLSVQFDIAWIGFTLWGLIILCHGILAYRWDQTKGDVKDLMKWLFVLHLIAYAAGVTFMIGLNFMIWEGRIWWITAALGWAAGLVAHFLIYTFVKEEEKDALKISLGLHYAAYIVVQALLVWLNLAIWQGRFWVPTVALGWGVGLAAHTLTYMLYKKDYFVPTKGLNVSVLYHLVGYVMVNGLLVWLNLANWQGFLWFPIPLIAWGIGLGAHGIIASQLGGRLASKT